MDLFGFKRRKREKKATAERRARALADAIRLTERPSTAARRQSFADQRASRYPAGQDVFIDDDSPASYGLRYLAAPSQPGEDGRSEPVSSRDDTGSYTNTGSGYTNTDSWGGGSSSSSSSSFGDSGSSSSSSSSDSGSSGF